MKKAIIIAIVILASASLRAQEVRPIESSVEDYIALLNQSGYQAYSFDISQLMDTTYYVQFEVREYVAGNPDPVMVQPYGRGLKNRTMVKDFMWRELSKEELADIKKDSFNYKKGIYSIAEKITVCFMPSQTDSTAKGRIYVSNMGSIGIDLKLRAIQTNTQEKPIYKYLSRPFKASSFETGRFIPMVLYCSFWYDTSHNFIRCCGETEIDPEMSADILKDSPHYYVIGMVISPK